MRNRELAGATARALSVMGRTMRKVMCGGGGGEGGMGLFQLAGIFFFTSIASAEDFFWVKYPA